MKSTELRIRNLVFDALGNAVKCDLTMIGNIDLMKLKPIPLTEEWLLKFGFEKHTNEMHIDGIEMRLQLNDKTYFSSCGTLDGGIVVLCLCRGNYFANNISFVHELQNLFFAIKGLELELKSNPKEVHENKKG